MCRSAAIRRMALLALLSLGALTACGGGGGGGDSAGSGGGGNSPPPLTPPPPTTYSVSGSVSGLGTSPVVLQNNGGDSRTVSANGGFQFPTALATGSAYNVTVLTQPSDHTCTVTAGSGTIANAAVTNVAVTCQAQPEPTSYHTISGAISGLSLVTPGNGVLLENNASDETAFYMNGPFTFRIPVVGGTVYDVTISGNPIDEQCTVTSGSGVATENVINVSVTCQALTAPVYLVFAEVTGLLKSAVVLQINGGERRTVRSNGGRPFPTGLPAGAAYSISVLTQPSDRTCTVTAGTGIMPAAQVTTPRVTCTGPAPPPPPFADNQVEVISDGLRLTTSVKICIVGSTICQTIDRVAVDSGSTGLRIFAPVTIPLPQLAPSYQRDHGPAVGNGGLYECYGFASTSTYGPVHQADVYIGESKASRVALQLRGVPQTGFFPCGALTPESVGFNGILGIDSEFDCGPFCANSDQNLRYFLCQGVTCARSRANTDAQVVNPIYSLNPYIGAGWNLDLPASTPGATSIKGLLTMGSQFLPNNTVPVSATKLFGPQSTNANGMVLPVSTFDTGAPATTLPPQVFGSVAPPQCGIYYCPAAPTPINFSLVGNNGDHKEFTLTFVSPSGANVAGQFAGVTSSSSVIFGLPFFYGRHVYWFSGSDPFIAFE